MAGPYDARTDIDNAEAAKLLLEEWQFRQQHCWNILPRFGFTAAVVSLAPYLKLELLRQPVIDLRLFPLVGWVLAMAAAWLFVAEQHRAHAVLENYRKLLGKERIHRTDKPWSRALDRLKVRWTTALIYILFFSVLSFLNYRNLSRFR
jgi:hypothetical protein